MKWSKMGLRNVESFCHTKQMVLSYEKQYFIVLQNDDAFQHSKHHFVIQKIRKPKLGYIWALKNNGGGCWMCGGECTCAKVPSVVLTHSSEEADTLQKRVQGWHRL